MEVEERKEEVPVMQPESPKIEVRHILVVTDDVWCSKKVKSAVTGEDKQITFVYDSI